MPKRDYAGDGTDDGEADDSALPAEDGFEELLRAAVHVPRVGLPAPERQALFEGRFRIRRRLGEGGMGVVYEAEDRERGEIVALKTLSRLEPSGVYRLKREFRSLCHVLHPNLVALHELFFDRDHWFFTMDLVEGQSFTSYCEMRVGDEGLGRRAQRFGEPWFHELLRQLLRGVSAIHEAGKLHRDLKPSNVLVSAQGHVAILDFGLVTDQADQSGLTTDGGVPGTPAYMSPEQAAGARPSPECDVYGIGVILYQALTGVLPFDGPTLKLLHDKRERDPVPPCERSAGVPARLSALCMRLLSRDPAQRPSLREALLELDVAPTSEARASHSAVVGDAAAFGSPDRFVGRHAQLLGLSRAFERSRSGRPLVVLVRGSSGMGKTALVKQFVRGLSRDRAALVLQSRCYEREAVPFKAFDGIVDELSHHLRRLPRHEASSLLPRDIHSLGRVFPSLRRAQPVSDAGGRITDSSDPVVLRQRAFRALKEMLQRLSDRHPLVLFIDDLQWSDVDSARLLEEIVSPPDPPQLLLIGCYRREQAESSDFLQHVLRGPRHGLSAEELYRVRLSSMLRAEVGSGPSAPREPSERGARGPTVDDITLRSLTEVVELNVDRLNRGEAAALARSLLGAAGRDEYSDLAEQIASESDGIPLFVHELVQHVCAGAYGPRPAQSARALASLDQMLGARIAALPPDARGLIEAIVVAGRPIGQDLALRAAGLSPGDVRTIALLRAQSLVRTRGAGPTDAVEAYHDHVARAVRAAMSVDAARRCHGRVAATLEGAGAASPEWLAELFEGAGVSDRAARYAMQAADQARGSLAFSRAQELTRRALSLFRSEEAHRVRQGAVIGAVLGVVAGSLLASLAVHYFKTEHELATKLGIYFMGLVGGAPVGMMLGSIASLFVVSDPEGALGLPQDIGVDDAPADRTGDERRGSS